MDLAFHDVDENDLDREAFTCFVRALLFRLAAYEGVVVDKPSGGSCIVWNNPETKELVISTNEQDIPVGAFIWMHETEERKN